VSVLIRQPQAFEGFGVIPEALQVEDPAFAHREDISHLQARLRATACTTRHFAFADLACEGYLVLKLLIASLGATALLAKHQDAAVVDVDDSLPVEVEVVEMLAHGELCSLIPSWPLYTRSSIPSAAVIHFDVGVVVLQCRLDSATVVRVGGLLDELHVLLRHRLPLQVEVGEVAVRVDEHLRDPAATGVS
jgi:hypothetical protein